MSEPEQTNEQTDVSSENTGLSGQKKTALAMFGLLLVTYVLMVADRFLVSMLATDIRGALDLSVPNMFALTTMFTLGLGIGGLPLPHSFSVIQERPFCSQVSYCSPLQPYSSRELLVSPPCSCLLSYRV